MREKLPMDLYIGGMYNGMTDTVQCVVRSLIATIEDLPDFQDLQPDDTAVLIVQKLREVQYLTKIKPEPTRLANDHLMNLLDGLLKGKGPGVR